MTPWWGAYFICSEIWEEALGRAETKQKQKVGRMRVAWDHRMARADP